MGRKLEPHGKTAQIVIHPKNEEEGELFRKFKGVLLKDNQTIREFFLSSIQSKVVKDNPQLHFVKTSDTLVLSKNLPEVEPAEKITCTRCGGEGCQHCAQFGYYYEESAP